MTALAHDLTFHLAKATVHPIGPGSPPWHYEFDYAARSRTLVLGETTRAQVAAYRPNTHENRVYRRRILKTLRPPSPWKRARC